MSEINGKTLEPGLDPARLRLHGEIQHAWIGTASDRLAFAEKMSQARTTWPAELDKFPLNKFGLLKKVVLKVLSMLFRDQREVNQAMIQAARGSLFLNRRMLDQISQLERGLKEVQQKLSGAMREPTADPAQGEDSGLSADTFYTLFEDRFRGPPEEIKKRLEFYLTYIIEAGFGKMDSAILDIGCGRGEWLELLTSRGFVCRGVDTNQVSSHQCRLKGLDVICGDALEHLKAMPDGSLGVVTGFHLIEHLPFEVMLRLFRESFRVLRPGGFVIFETPNPQNMLVGTFSFYLDPTHRNPLPAPMVQFAAECHGLQDVRILGMHPYPDKMKLSGSPVAERFNEYFYGFQDYAVLGYKR